MSIVGVREFRDEATAMFRSKEPIVVLRRGRIAGLFFPYPAETLPVEFKRELFVTLTDQISRRLRAAGLTEEEILEDFERFRHEHRTARRRR
jgi:hypothetical protein